MRVLAVGEVEHLLERHRVLARGSRPRARRTSARSRCRSARCRRTPRARGSRACGPRAALALAQLVEHRVVALGRDHHGREVVVLGGRADQRRPADVDVLDHLVRRPPRAATTRARTGRGSRTRGRSARSRARSSVRHVLVVRAHREQAGVDARVERLDAAVEDLGEARVVLDRPDRDALVLQLLRRCRRWRRSRRRARPGRARSPPGRACRTPTAAPGGRGPRRGRPAPTAALSLARHPRSAAAGDCRVGMHAALRDQPHRTRQQPVLDLVDSLLDLGDPARIGNSAKDSCKTTGPLSTPSSTRWTVTPMTFTP